MTLYNATYTLIDFILCQHYQRLQGVVPRS